MKRIQLLVLPALLMACLWVCLPASAQPLGYERWSNSTANTDVFFDTTFGGVMNGYADPMVIGMEAPPKKDTRLIDIEFNYAPNSSELRISGIWVEQAGNFKQESWFMPQLAEADIDLLEKIPDLVIVDIERYERRGQNWFAAIVERNRVKQDWVFLGGITLSGVHLWRSQGYRVIDIDYLYAIDDGGEELPEAIFDVIIAKNAGDNQMNDRLTVMTEANYWDLSADGYDIHDVEYVPEWNMYVCASVEVGGSLWDLLWNTDAADVVNYDLGKVVDLEGSHNGPKKWYRIHKY